MAASKGPVGCTRELAGALDKMSKQMALDVLMELAASTKSIGGGGLAKGTFDHVIARQIDDWTAPVADKRGERQPGIEKELIRLQKRKEKPRA